MRTLLSRNRLLCCCVLMLQLLPMHAADMARFLPVPKKNGATLKSWDSIAIVLLETNSSFVFHPPKGKGAEVGIGIGEGALLGAELHPIPIVGSTLGAIAGGFLGLSGASKKEAARSIPALQGALARINTREYLQKQLVLAAETAMKQNLHPFDTTLTNELDRARLYWKNGMQAALEVDSFELGLTEPPTFQNKAAVFVTVRTRLTDLNEEEVLHQMWWSHLSAPRPYSEWTANDGSVFEQACNEIIHDLSEEIIDELFLVDPVEPQNPDCFGLEALEPRQKAHYLLGTGPPEISFPKVKSLSPTLKWKPYPSWPQDLSYEVKIWRCNDMARGPLVYHQTGIKQPEHQLTQPLTSDSRYLWSVRARFTRDGHPRAGSWSMKKLQGSYINSLPHRWIGQMPAFGSYNFQTP